MIENFKTYSLGDWSKLLFFSGLIYSGLVAMVFSTFLLLTSVKADTSVKVDIVKLDPTGQKPVYDNDDFLGPDVEMANIRLYGKEGIRGINETDDQYFNRTAKLESSLAMKELVELRKKTILESKLDEDGD